MSDCLPHSAASQLKSQELSLPEGKVRVKLDHDGTILDVDEDDIEKVGGGWWRALEVGWAGQACPLAVQIDSASSVASCLSCHTGECSLLRPPRRSGLAGVP